MKSFGRLIRLPARTFLTAPVNELNVTANGSILVRRKNDFESEFTGCNCVLAIWGAGGRGKCVLCVARAFRKFIVADLKDNAMTERWREGWTRYEWVGVICSAKIFPSCSIFPMLM